MRPLSRLLIPVALLIAGWLPLAASATPVIQHWHTANNTRVYFVPAPELPMVTARIVFDAGAARDGDKPGLAQLTNLLLESGTKDLSADAVADRLDGVGAQLDGGAERDMAWLSLRSLVDPRYLTPAVNTVARLLNEPVFETAAFERERQRMIAGVKASAQSPATIGSQAFYKALYGDHPYAADPDGTEASLAAITRAEVQAFHHRYYVAANGLIVIVGALDRKGAEALAESLVGGLPKGEGAPALPPVPPTPNASVVRIPFPSTQSHVFIGQIGISRHDPDYFSLYLGNHVLGGNGLVSRLAEEIREKRGLSYSSYSYFAPMRQAGPFVMGLQTRNDRVDEAINVMRDTLRGFAAAGPKVDALEAARQNITGGFALRIDSNGKIAQYLAMIGFHELSLRYLDTFPDKINALTLDQVRDAFRRRVDPDRLITVVVGG